MKNSIRRRRAYMLPTLILALALLLTACGGDAEDVSGNITPSENNETPSAGGTVTSDTDGAQDDGEAEPTPSDTPLSIGRLQGGVYTNEYIGIACELDSAWVFYTAEELNENMELTSGMFEGTELEDAVADVEQFLDMQAENADILSGINIIYNKMGMQDRIAYATLSEEEIIDATLDMSDTLIQSYAQAGIDVLEMSKKAVSFLGEERLAIWTSAQIEGASYYTLQLFDYHLGQYGVTITFYSYIEDRTEELLDLFYAV